MKTLSKYGNNILFVVTILFIAFILIGNIVINGITSTASFEF